MVFARTKLLIHDDLLRPRPRMVLHYRGPNPQRFYYEIPHILATVWRVAEDAIQEKKFSWTPESFSVTWELSKDLDRFSYFIVTVALDGAITKEGIGTATAVIEGALRTEYPQDTFWEKSLLYEFLRMTWHTIFYRAHRESWMIEGRRMMSMFIADLKSLLRA
jgi:hypothetical protein